jgi:hypothetical protein
MNGKANRAIARQSKGGLGFGGSFLRGASLPLMNIGRGLRRKKNGDKNKEG